MKSRVVLTRLTCLLFVVGGLVAPPRAWTQELTSEELIEQAGEAGLDRTSLEHIHGRAKMAGLSNEEYVRMVQPAVQLARQDLPVKGVLRKVKEGLGKGIAPGRIVSVVSGVVRQTEEAGGLVASWLERPEARQLIAGRGRDSSAGTREELITSIVEVRQENVSLRAIEGLLLHMPHQVNRSVEAAQIGAAFQLLVPHSPEGQVIPAVRNLVSSALQAGFAPRALVESSRVFSVGLRRGDVPVDQLAAQMARRIRQGQVPGARPGLLLERVAGPPGEIPAGVLTVFPSGGEVSPGRQRGTEGMRPNHRDRIP